MKAHNRTASRTSVSTPSFKKIVTAVSIAILMGAGTQGVSARDIADINEASANAPAPTQKTMYALSSSLGAVGVALEANGWSLRLHDLETMPNGTDVILYVNAHDQADNKRLAAFVSNFKGVLVVDSLVLGENLSADGAGIPTAAESFAKITQSKLGLAVPVGTAIVASMNRDALLPLTVSEDGTINGAEISQLDLVADLSVIARENSGPRAKNQFASDQLVEMNRLSDNWAFRARVIVEANKTGNGAGGELFHVTTNVDTGAAGADCLVGGFKCGIYPLEEHRIVRSQRNSSTGVVSLTGWATRYSAYVTGYGVQDNVGYKPFGADWDLQQNQQNQQYETPYTKGLPISAATWVNAISSGPWAVAATIIDTSLQWTLKGHNKARGKLQAWEGFSGIKGGNYYSSFPGATSGAFTGLSTVDSGIQLKASERPFMTHFEGGNYVDHLQFEALAREKLMTGQTGLHCNGKAKSRFAYEGFQPSLTVTQRAAQVSGKPLSTYSSQIGRTYVVLSDLVWTGSGEGRGLATAGVHG